MSSGSSAWTLDVPKLALVVDAVRHHEGMSQRELARKLGISPNVITRLNQGHRPDTDALTSICMWLKDDLRHYAEERGTP